MQKGLGSIALVTVISSLLISGCTILPDDEWNALQAEKAAAKAEAEAKADAVKFVPSELVQNCEYIDQTSTVQKLSFFGGLEATEERAKREMQYKAAELGANSIRISDRLHDKGRGGADSTSLTLYGDLYNC